MKPENLKKHNVDLMIAANAVANRAVLVSADGLFTDLQEQDTRFHCEDWTSKDKQ